MFSCTICNMTFDKKFNLTRHQGKSKWCMTVAQKTSEIEGLKKTVNEFTALANKRRSKCKKLKDALKTVIEQEKSLSEQLDIERKSTRGLKSERDRYESENTKLKKEVKKLSSDREFLYHKLSLAETRIEEKDKADERADMIIRELSRNGRKTSNKTIINNNIVIQDFRIKPASEFSGHYEEITKVISDHSIEYTCRYLLERFYNHIPPNIQLADQARKKIFIVRQKKWVQEDLEELVHKLYHKSFKRLALNCINEQIDMHEELIVNPIINDEEKEKYEDEILRWNGIRITWEKFDSRKLHKPMLVTLNNLKDPENTKALLS